MAVPVATTTVLYRIDSRDVLVETGGGWDAFADANGGMSPVLGRPLWHFVAGADVRSLWAHLLRRVRTEWERLTFLYRCDGPGIRRLLEMQVRALGDGSVAFQSRVLRTVRAETLPGRWATDSWRPTIAVCGWCGRMGAGVWARPEEAADRLGLDPTRPQLFSHSVCEACAQELRARPRPA